MYVPKELKDLLLYTKETYKNPLTYIYENCNYIKNNNFIYVWPFDTLALMEFLYM